MILTLEILGQDGHTTVEWNPDKPDEVAKARAEFDKLKEAGFLLFTVEEVSEFPAGEGKVMAELVAGPAETPAAAPLDATVRPRTKRRRGKGTQTREFDPTKRTVAVRPMRGGSCRD